MRNIHIQPRTDNNELRSFLCGCFITACRKDTVRPASENS